MNLILLGAPGAGKGTQAELLTKKLGIPAISTGNMLREAIRNETQIGKQVKTYMETGALVPDEVVISLVRERVARPDCAKGFILDGVPRTVHQAQCLEDMGIRIDHVISIEIDDDVIEARMTGRRVCPHCGASYHIVANPPKRPDLCNNCESRLTIRSDDDLQTVRNRLRIYHGVTETIKDFYAKRGKLRLIQGNVPIEVANQDILKTIGGEA